MRPCIEGNFLFSSSILHFWQKFEESATFERTKFSRVNQAVTSMDSDSCSNHIECSQHLIFDDKLHTKNFHSSAVVRKIVLQGHTVFIPLNSLETCIRNLTGILCKDHQQLDCSLKKHDNLVKLIIQQAHQDSYTASNQTIISVHFWNTVDQFILELCTTESTSIHGNYFDILEASVTFLVMGLSQRENPFVNFNICFGLSLESSKLNQKQWMHFHIG